MLDGTEKNIQNGKQQSAMSKIMTQSHPCAKIVHVKV